MTGSEHRKEAERLLEMVPPRSAADIFAKAQTHALLALYDVLVVANSRSAAGLGPR